MLMKLNENLFHLIQVIKKIPYLHRILTKNNHQLFCLSSTQGRGWGGLAPPTFHVVSGKFLSNHPKTVCQILTNSLLTVAFCQTVRRGVSAKYQPLPLLKNIESSASTIEPKLPRSSSSINHHNKQ